MIQAIVPGALTFALLTASQASVPVTPSAQFQTTSVPSVQKLIWVVKPEDTLFTIAKSYYGDENYWTTLWNDNPSLVNPSTITPGEIITLRLQTPKQAETLDEKQSELYAALTYVAPTPSPVSVSATSSYAGGPLTDAQITYLGTCEAGMTANRNSGNGYYGAFQFSIGTWNSMNTGYERADLAPLEVQKDAVQRLLSRSSIFTQFPGCARKMQAAGLL